jgi:hypothetical protein
MALAQIVHFDECVVIPEDQVWIKEQIVENTKLVMMALGYDEDEDGDGGYDSDDDTDEEEECDSSKESEVIPASEIKPES